SFSPAGWLVLVTGASCKARLTSELGHPSTGSKRTVHWSLVAPTLIPPPSGGSGMQPQARISAAATPRAAAGTGAVTRSLFYQQQLARRAAFGAASGDEIEPGRSPRAAIGHAVPRELVVAGGEEPATERGHHAPGDVRDHDDRRPSLRNADGQAHSGTGRIW